MDTDNFRVCNENDVTCESNSEQMFWGSEQMFWGWTLMKKTEWTKKCWMWWMLFHCIVGRQISGVKFTGHVIQLEINFWLGTQIRVPLGKKNL